MYNRLCLFGLPRCGSQYIVELIKNNSGIKYTDLFEPYTCSINSDMPLPILTNDNNIRMEFLNGYVGDNTLEKRINYIDSILQKANKHCNLTLRLFPYNYLWDKIPDIIERLKCNNFSFLIIKRSDLEKHALSYIIAQLTNEWNSVTPIAHKKVFVPFELFESIEYIIKNSVNFLNFCNKINLHGPIITYENAVRDLENLFNRSFVNNVKFRKQGMHNPYDQIINANEVKMYVNSLLNKHVKQ